MPNRYTRDELIAKAINKVQVAALENHDMPRGVVQPDAFSIDWLQEILDFWYHMVPYSTTVTSTALNITAHNNTVLVPDDFIVDVRNGFLVESIPGDSLSMGRLERVPFQKFLARKLYYQKTTQDVKFPFFYCVIGKDSVTKKQNIMVTPTPTQLVNGELWFYQLPAVLGAEDIPSAVSDYVCIEYIRIRALEWVRVYEPGTAQKFCDKLIAGMKAGGLLNEPEDDELPFDAMVFSKGRSIDARSTFAWMGPR